MTTSSNLNPYAGNILIDPLGPILDRPAAARALTFLPARPENPALIAKHIRLRYIVQLRDFHWASLEGLRIQESIDLVVRESYRYRDPIAPQTWSMICGENVAHKTPRAPAMAVLVVGHSGAGKTQAILRPLCIYPNQVVPHETFPMLVGRHYQLVWLSVDVPASGRSVDLAAELMSGFDSTMERHIPGWEKRFTTSISRTRRNGQQMLDEWRQVASAHFLGALHLDEVQNFFKLPTLKKRRSTASAPADLELSIVEDQCLKWILTLTNTWQIPIILSGTSDGVGALMKRFANTQRFASGGYHPINNFTSAEDPAFFSTNPKMPGFLNALGKYQYMAEPLEINVDVARLIFEFSAGIPRLIIALWVAAHRVALESPGSDKLSINDIKRAADTFLAPIKPAVSALRSKDPRLISRFEDLMPRNDNFWASFWTSMSR